MSLSKHPVFPQRSTPLTFQPSRSFVARQRAERLKGSRRFEPAASMASSSLSLSPDFGWVLGAAAFSGIVYIWQTIRIGAARRKYKVKLPDLYAKGDDEGSKTFNCIQRTHQNTAETIGPVMAITALLGLYKPITAASLCTAWALGRIMYTLGYSTGDPSKRTPGFAISFFSMAGLILTCAVVGIRSALQA